jgi:hypothetical protein
MFISYIEHQYLIISFPAIASNTYTLYRNSKSMPWFILVVCMLKSITIKIKDRDVLKILCKQGLLC